MLNRIIAASLRGRTVVLSMALLIGGYGLWSATQVPIDVLPDLNRPVVTIMTEAHGMAPEAVEQLVSWPIEQVMNGATGVFRTRSSSAAGLSVVWVEFEWDTDIYRDRQVVAEKLQLARAKLPDEVETFLAPISSIMGQIQLVGFQSTDGGTSATELRLIIDRDVQPRIRAISGVAQIVTIGGQPTELQIVVDADKLRTFDVTLHEVERAVGSANVTAEGGYLQIGSKGPLISVPGLIENADEMKLAVVRADGIRPVRIEDVAEVTFGPTAIRAGDAGIDGSPGVIMVISKQPGVDTLALTDRVLQELKSVQADLPSDVTIIEDLFLQSAFINRAIDNVLAAVKDGGILVIIILFLFLLSFRTTIITLTAIPLSIACAVLVFRAFGLTINTMTLGGLAVAIGTLVDDAIVDVENVFRRLHENSGLDRPLPTLKVIFNASSEIRKPLIYGTLLVTVVYFPLLFLSGIEGKLFRPIGIAYIVSVLASLVVALTVTPVMCYYLLGIKETKKRSYGGWLVGVVHRMVEWVIRLSLKHPARVLVLLLAATLSSGAVFYTRGQLFLPAFNEGSYQVNLILDPGTNLETSDAFGKRLEQVLIEIDGVEHVGRRTGRASGDEHAMPVSVTEAIVTIDPMSSRSREQVLEDIRDRIATDFPGVMTATEQPLQHLLDHLLSGVTASVAIKISGPDLDVLRMAAKDVEAAIENINGVRDLYVEPQVLMDQVEVRPRRKALAALGLTANDVAETVELAMGSREISRMRAGTITFPMIIRLEEEDRATVNRIRGLYLRQSGGGLVLLSDVADVTLSKTPSNINRENGQRRIAVQHNVEGRSLSEVVADVERAIAPIRTTLASEAGSYSVTIGGQFEAQEEASRVMMILSVLALGVMLLILYAHFQSLGLSLIVLLSRPIAFIGAVVAIVITDQDVSIATLVGLIALLGVSARNAILLIDHYVQLMRHEGLPIGIPLLVQAGQQRAIPILMTALTSGIGLVPLALSPGVPGREILYPVATVIIGGLITSTLLDFLLTPSLIWMFGQKELERVSSTEQSEEWPQTDSP